MAANIEVSVRGRQSNSGMLTQEDSIQGKLVTFEGIDGAGKTSIVSRLPPALRLCKVPILICGERRSPFADILANKELRSMSAFLKTYLFAADRAWAYEKECLPALKRGALVLWDRYVDSALVYRSAELALKKEAVDLEFVRQINRPFRQADLTFYIRISIETSEKRTRSAAASSPYKTEFLTRVLAEYERLIEERGYVAVDGEKLPDLVIQEVADHIRRTFLDLFRS
jgi:dTMP kinase